MASAGHEPLPPKGSEYWLDGDVSLHQLKPALTCLKGEHYFEYVSGREADCTKCPMGFRLPVDAEVKDGHIYIESQLLI